MHCVGAASSIGEFLLDVMLLLLRPLHTAYRHVKRVSPQLSHDHDGIARRQCISSLRLDCCESFLQHVQSLLVRTALAVVDICNRSLRGHRLTDVEADGAILFPTGPSGPRLWVLEKGKRRLVVLGSAPLLASRWLTPPGPRLSDSQDNMGIWRQTGAHRNSNS